MNFLRRLTTYIHFLPKMKFLVLLGALCVAQYTLAEQIDVEVCNADVTNTFVNNIDLAIDPNPIEVKAGKTISLHFGVDVLKEVAVGATLELKLKKGLLPIPCIDVSIMLEIFAINNLAMKKCLSDYK